MLRQFLVGGGFSLVNIALHALVMTMVVQVAQNASEHHRSRARGRSHGSLFLIAVMIPTVTVLMLVHTLEVMVWSLAYWLIDAAPEGANLIFLAFVSYATLGLGYGDIAAVERWQLLGPIVAMNGVLLYGWSTAVIFEVLRRTLELSVKTSGDE